MGLKLKSRKKGPEAWFRKFWLACLGVTLVLALKTLAWADSNAVFLVFRSLQKGHTVWEVSFESDANSPCRLRGTGLQINLEALKDLQAAKCQQLSKLALQIKDDLKISKKAFQEPRSAMTNGAIEVRGYGAVRAVKKEDATSAASNFLAVLSEAFKK